jgi:hypothetical protein
MSSDPSLAGSLMAPKHTPTDPLSRLQRTRKGSILETSPNVLHWLQGQPPSLPPSSPPSPSSRERKRESSVSNDPATQDHKRQRRTSDSTILPRPRLAPETLRLLDGSDGPGQTRSTMDASSLLTASSDSNEAITPYHPRFIDELRARGVCLADFDEGNSPENLDELKAGLFRDRDSPDPDEGTVNVFRQLVEKAGNETGVTQHLLPKVLPVIEQALLNDDDATVANQQWDPGSPRNPTGETSFRCYPCLLDMTLPLPEFLELHQALYSWRAAYLG